MQSLVTRPDTLSFATLPLTSEFGIYIFGNAISSLRIWDFYLHIFKKNGIRLKHLLGRRLMLERLILFGLHN